MEEGKKDFHHRRTRILSQRKSVTMVLGRWYFRIARIYRHHAAKGAFRSHAGSLLASWRKKRSRRDGGNKLRYTNGKKEETASGTRPRRWRCVKVEVVVGSDLIIYAAGSRDLPLRFTAFRKQEQIEGALECSRGSTSTRARQCGCWGVSLSNRIPRYNPLHPLKKSLPNTFLNS